MSEGLSGGGLFNFLVATDVAAGQAKVNKALTKKQAAENAASAKQATLARWSQSLANQKIMDKAGKAYSTASENIGRALDNQSMSKVQRQLALSERLGATTAAFAAAGLGGASTETYKRTMETSAALQEEAQTRNDKSTNYLMVQDRGDIMTQGIDSQGRDVIMGNFDFTNYGPTKGPSLLGNLAALGMAAAASAAGAPDIGNAILEGRTAGMLNRAGDGRGAASAMSRMFEDVKSGVNSLRDSSRQSFSFDRKAYVPDGPINVNPDTGPLQLPSIGMSNSIIMR